ncbi:MAG: nitrilotriacetate monooxygenase [Citromicrobium sp.]|nr:nitrilotriacetate monooxygenase [Citromicrobium sp.]
MIDQSAFRDALGTFVTGVTIVTTYDEEGQPAGLTANSFNSVSLDPPMVLWSLSLGSRNLPVFRTAKAWAVHVLAADQQDLSNRFASRGADKFGDLDCGDGPEGAPRIEGCAARFGCEAKFEYEGGDHAIFLGEVIDFERTPAEPLIYHGGRYGRVMREGEQPGDADKARLVADGLILRDGEKWRLTEAGLAQFALLRQIEGG